MEFDTKIAVVLRDDLAGWQRVNVTAFLASGVAAATPGLTGEAYEDADGVTYLPMFRQPVLVFATDADGIARAYARARTRDLALAIFPQAIFATGHDAANRAAVRELPSGGLDLAGFALRAERKLVDKVIRGLALHT